jgi:methylene-tetrahydromethanopterin dehydrogenase
MERPYILHMISPGRNVSPFDVNMASDAGYNLLMPYTDVGLDQVQGLVQDAIFSRGPKGVKRTGLFIGGREVGLAMDMLEQAKQAMVPPFEVSVFADPSGAFTTAAAMVACVEHWLQKTSTQGLQGRQVVIFGGTGPVGTCAGVIAAQNGAEVRIASHRTARDAQAIADVYNTRYGVRMQGAGAATDEEKLALLEEAEIVMGAAKAGVQVLTQAHLERAPRLAAAVDVNAVPPLGIDGIDLQDNGKVLEATPGRAVGIGALAVGNVKYVVQQNLFKEMLQADRPVYLDFLSAFEMARRHVA